MSIRAHAVVDAVEQALPLALISDRARRALTELARPLPVMAQSVGFECALAPGVDIVDIGMCVTAAHIERDSLAGRTCSSEMDRLVAINARWGRIRAFAERWGCSRKLSTARIPFVFLEFDAQATQHRGPVPSVFVALDWFLEELTPEARHNARADGSVLAPGLPDAREIAETLAGSPLAPEVSERLTRAFVELPPAALALHVGVMLGRARRSVRVSVAVPRVEVMSYLGRVGWRGDAAELSRMIDESASACGLEHSHARLQVDFDLEDGMSDALGIGLTPGPGQTWADLLSRLSDIVSCDEEKLRALDAWPGQVAHARESDTALDCYLSHLKLAWKPDGAFAKGYFGVSSANPGA